MCSVFLYMPIRKFPNYKIYIDTFSQRGYNTSVNTFKGRRGREE